MKSGLATGEAQLVQLNPVGGLQLKNAAPDALSVVLLPLHTKVSDPAFILGTKNASIVLVAVSLHPLLLVAVS